MILPPHATSCGILSEGGAPSMRCGMMDGNGMSSTPDSSMRVGDGFSAMPDCAFCGVLLSAPNNVCSSGLDFKNSVNESFCGGGRPDPVALLGTNGAVITGDPSSLSVNSSFSSVCFAKHMRNRLSLFFFLAELLVPRLQVALFGGTRFSLFGEFFCARRMAPFFLEVFLLLDLDAARVETFSMLDG